MIAVIFNIIEYFYWTISLDLEFKLTSGNKNKYDDLLFQLNVLSL